MTDQGNEKEGSTMEHMNAKRIACRHEERIHASARSIFPLLCPTAELKWIEGWDKQHAMIYSVSGVNEKHCMFKEYLSGPFLTDTPLTTFWITTVHDPDAGRIEFVLLIGDAGIMTIDLTVTETGASRSSCRWDMTLTTLDQTMHAIPDQTIREKMLVTAATLSRLLKHYCETGSMMAFGAG
ncbi:MAG: hypothetical protein ACOZF0_07140 [Thermodesulfobacteriota bacterium]